MTSDVVKIAIANGVVSLLGMIISGVIALLLKKMNDNAQKAADAVKSVKVDLSREGDRTKSLLDNVRNSLKDNDQNLSDKLLDIKKTTEATHLLVNSAMCDQLKISSSALRRIAEFTGRSEDIVMAEAADKALSDILARQVP